MDNNSMFLPRHLRNVEHIAAFEDTINKRFGDIDVSPTMMYMIDTCSNIGLPFLADQFGCFNTREYQLATNDDERRRVIKDAVRTRSYMGTVGVIKNIMQIYGFDPNWLVERCDEGTDPTYGWAHFRIDVPVGFEAASGVSAVDLSELILQYKPARCRYLGAYFEITGFTDTFPSGSEELEFAVGYEMEDAFDTAPFKYDGVHKYDGSMKYRSNIETVEITTV